MTNPDDVQLDARALEAAAAAHYEAATGAKWVWVTPGSKEHMIQCQRTAIRKYLSLAQQPQAPAEGWRMVPVEPTPELLMSMACRTDHGLGCPGYYDQPMFGASGIGHARRLEVALDEARRQHEEVVGTGFYSEANKARYAAMLTSPPPPPRQDGDEQGVGR